MHLRSPCWRPKAGGDAANLWLLRYTRRNEKQVTLARASITLIEKAQHPLHSSARGDLEHLHFCGRANEKGAENRQVRGIDSALTEEGELEENRKIETYNVLYDSIKKLDCKSEKWNSEQEHFLKCQVASSLIRKISNSTCERRRRRIPYEICHSNFVNKLQSFTAEVKIVTRRDNGAAESRQPVLYERRRRRTPYEI